MTELRKLRVFLCHASQDKPIVRELYQRLLAEGWIDPWLDEEKLLPGMNWDMEIERAVETTDVVVVCLSNASITKEGYVQRELKFVLDIALEKPEETIFIIPLRLDNIQPPRRLRNWQYTDYFPLEQRLSSYNKLRKSLQLRIQQTDVANFTNPNQKNTTRGDYLRDESQTEKQPSANNRENEQVINLESHVFFLPFSISIETVNEVSTPIFDRGESLPAKMKTTFSTATDNQSQVQIHLLLGENIKAYDNLSLGKFVFDNIAPAPKGVPQIELQFSISQNLELTYVAVDIKSGQVKNYQPINLRNLTPPPVKESIQSKTDLPPNGTFENSDGFSDFFKTIFGDSLNNKLSYEQNVNLSFEEAGLGTVRQIESAAGKLKIRIPAGVNTGSKVRVSSILPEKDGTKGDLYLVISVSQHPFFRRENFDLYITYPISKRLASQGGEIPVPLLERGKSVIMEIPPNTKDKQVFRLKGKGIETPNDPYKKGDFYITVDLYDSRTMSQSQKKVLKEINDYINLM